MISWMKIFLTKLGREGVQPAIYFLDFILKETTNQYWMKLLRFLSYLKCTIDYVLTFEADDEQRLYWYVDANCFCKRRYENQ